VGGVVHPSYFRHAVGVEACSREGGLDGAAPGCRKHAEESSGVGEAGAQRGLDRGEGG
jgi:hypothetical protein